MNNSRLWLLLRHEFRLRQRDKDWNWQSNLKACLVFAAILAIGMIVLNYLVWQFKGQLLSRNLSSLLQPDVALPINCGIVYGIVIIGLSSGSRYWLIKFASPYSIVLPHTAPIPPRTILRSYILNDLLTNTLIFNVWLLPITIIIAYACGTGFVILPIHLVITALIGITYCLSIWWVYMSVKWHKNRLFQGLMTIISLLLIGAISIWIGGIILKTQIFIPETIVERLEQFHKSLVAQNGWFGPASWLWIPGRGLLLEPYPAMGMITASIGLCWLTFQKPPDSLFQMLQTIRTTPPSAKTIEPAKIQDIKFQNNLLYILLIKEWRTLGWRKNTWFSLVFNILLTPGVMLLLTSNNAGAKAMLVITCVILWPTFYGLLFTISIFGREKDTVLLRSSPIDRKLIWVSKYLAVLLPIWGLAIPITMILSIMGQPWGWSISFLFASSICGVLLRSWNLHSITDENMLSANELDQLGIRDLKLLIWCELMSLIFWSAGFWLILKGQILEGLGGLLLEVFVMLLAYWRFRRLPDVLGF